MEELKTLRNGKDGEEPEDLDDNNDVQRRNARGVWANRLEFFLSIMGYTVGIGSVWRFPILCSRNGGGVFLIPFFIFLLLAGWPLYYLEVCLGQFTGKSAGLAFEYCPLLKGLGFLQVTISLIVSWYSCLILAWVYYYLYNSFFPTLPWTSCGNWWNTENCRVFINTLPTVQNTSSSYIDNISQNASLYRDRDRPENLTFSSATYEFWRHNTLGQSSGIDEMGSIQPHMAVCYFLGWATLILAICKGVKTLGKVVYVTATMPFILLTVMLVRGATLDGAIDGVIFFLKPNLTKLLEFQVWMEAAQQVFFSLGPSWGGVITMASYNKFHQNSFMETCLCVLTSGFSSIFNGVVVFTILGFMAKQSSKTVQEIASQSGAGLMFVVFPAALSEMPIPQLWSVLFFLAMLTVVFDSIFGGVEVASSAIIDLFPKQLVKRRVFVNICIGLTMFCLGLPLTMNGGIYILQVCDWYFSIFALLLGSALEAISLGWIYGMDRFCEDITLMTGKGVSLFFRFLWTIPVPAMLLFTFVMTLTRYTAPDYGDGYVYPQSAISLAICGGMSPIVVMVIIGLHEVVKARGSLQVLLRPSKKWLPNEEVIRKFYTSRQYKYEEGLLRRMSVNICGKKPLACFR